MKEILLVDDDHNVIALLSTIFENAGYLVHTGDRMDTALEIFREKNIQLIITDFHLAHGSGRRLLNEVRKISVDVPVFLITGTPFVNEEDFEIYGFTKVFFKPFGLKELLKEVEAAIP